MYELAYSEGYMWTAIVTGILVTVMSVFLITRPGIFDRNRWFRYSFSVVFVTYMAAIALKLVVVAIYPVPTSALLG